MEFESACDFIINKLHNELGAHLTYHNARHAKDVFEASKRLSHAENIVDEDKQLLQVAALFHDSGYIVKAEGHELISCDIARKELPQFQFSSNEIETICALIMATKLPSNPQNILEQIICDADVDYLGRDDFSLLAHDLFRELKSEGQISDTRAWNERQIFFLEQHSYFTATARRERGPKKHKNLQALKASMLTRQKNTRSPFSHISDYLLMLFGVFLSGFGLKGFLVPNNFLDGGVTGMSLLIHDIYKFNLSWVIILVNIPFVLAAIYVLNLKFALKTFLCIMALSFCLYFVHYPFITANLILAAIFGGFFMGLGVGITMRAGFALDGIEILALYTLRRTSFTISEIILGINVLIFSIAALKFGLETALYSMLTYFVASRTIDYVIEGWQAFTGVTIISGKSEEIKYKLVMEMGRGITVYKGERGFLPESFDVSRDCDIIFTVITRLEVRSLKNMVNDIDPKAFVFVSTIKEAAGGIIKRKNIH